MQTYLFLISLYADACIKINFVLQCKIVGKF